MNIARAESTHGGSSKLSLSNLPAAMLETAAARLCWIAIACACVSAGMHVVQRILQPEISQLPNYFALQINTIVVIVVSTLLAAAARPERPARRPASQEQE